MNEPNQGNPNIQVDLTDASEFHCFRLVLNPQKRSIDQHLEQSHRAFIAYQMRRRATEEEAERRWNEPGHAQDLHAAEMEAGLPTEPQPSIEIMLHARSLVDLIHKCSLALCDWQTQTSQYLIDRLTSISDPARSPGGWAEIKPARPHLGTHPITETTCDYVGCWCHRSNAGTGE